MVPAQAPTPGPPGSGDRRAVIGPPGARSRQPGPRRGMLAAHPADRQPALVPTRSADLHGPQRHPEGPARPGHGTPDSGHGRRLRARRSRDPVRPDGHRRARLARLTTGPVRPEPQFARFLPWTRSWLRYGRPGASSAPIWPHPEPGSFVGPPRPDYRASRALPCGRVACDWLHRPGTDSQGFVTCVEDGGRTGSF
jgi:hypothetical protein